MAEDIMAPGGQAAGASAAEGPKFLCDVCGKNYTLKRNLKRHMAKHDANARKYTCDYEGCGRVFLRNDDFNDHKKTHTQQGLLSCPHCPKKFSRLGDLKLHTRRHTKDTQFECTVCGRAFIRRCDLQAHNNRVHPASAAPELVPKQAQVATKPASAESGRQLPSMASWAGDEAPATKRTDLGLFASTALAKKELCPWSDCSCGLECKCKSKCDCGTVSKTDAEWAAVMESILQGFP